MGKCCALALVVLLAAGAVAHAQEPGDAAKGLAFAQRQCASCHGIKASDARSPKPELATFKTIANTGGMTGTALAVFLQTAHKSMPNFVLEDRDRNDVIAYILTLRDERGPK